MTEYNPIVPYLNDIIYKNKSLIDDWFQSLCVPKDLPLYASMDIRHSGYKMAVVDTNLFPAGFNNLNETDLQKASLALKHAIQSRLPSCQHILLIAEAHTRNLFYLENVYQLHQLIQLAGFEVTITSTFQDASQPIRRYSTSQEGHSVDILDISEVLKNSERQSNPYDLIVLNNDLIHGIPDAIQALNLPTYPSLKSGWHTREKTLHFDCCQTLIEDLCHQLEIDPWLISCLYTPKLDVDIAEISDRTRLADEAEILMGQIQKKYNEHHVNQSPFVFLKANYGSYGMGVIPIRHSEDILTLNRRLKNKLSTGKGSVPINSYFLQEGVPSIEQRAGAVSELCSYYIEDAPIGQFYRAHESKSAYDNLNSKGMVFHSSQNSELSGLEHLICLLSIYASYKEVTHYA